MDILNLPFDEPLIIEVNGERVQLFAFKTQEPGNIKFGIKASRKVHVHREEVFQIIKQKEEQTVRD